MAMRWWLCYETGGLRWAEVVVYSKAGEGKCYVKQGSRGSVPESRKGRRCSGVKER